MTDQDFRSPREPWDGYAQLGDDERDELLAKKFQQAKDQNDADYAMALAAAVANYELVLELQPDTTARRAARQPRARPPRRRRLVDVELAAIPAARRSRETENDYGSGEGRPRRGAAARTPSTCVRAGTRSPTRDIPPRAWAGRSRTPSCAGTWSRRGGCATDQPLSARHVWMAAKETDQREEYPSTFLEQDGTSLKAGLDVVRKFGAVLESELPWNGLASGPPEDYYRSAKSRRIMAYFNLGDDSVPDRTAHFAEWRKWLRAAAGRWPS